MQHNLTDYQRLMLALEQNEAFASSENEAEQRRMIGTIAADAGVSLLGLGMSVGQIIQGFKKMNRLQKPKTPNLPSPDLEASSRRAGAKLEAEQLPLQERRALDAALANQYAKDRKIAQSVSGDASRFAALMQANRMNSMSGLRHGLSDMQQMKTQRQSMYDNLLAQKAAENRFLYGAQMDRFGIENARYNQERAHASALINQGLINGLQGISNISGTAPMLRRMMQRRQLTHLAPEQEMPIDSPIPFQAPIDMGMPYYDDWQWYG